MSNLSLETRSNQTPRITWEGCSVLLDINDGDRLVFARLSDKSTVKIGNKKCSLRPLIGCRFGSLFQVETGPEGACLSRVVTIAALEDDDREEKGDPQLKDEVKDNRNIVDSNCAQNLSGEDIDEMKRQGATGEQIIEALIANSSTFEKKTLFSQEKYKLRKQKKYAPKVLLRRPFARSICEAYFQKYPARIGFLRVDVLSLLLSLANVSTSLDIIVVDMVGGILTGAVAERLGGVGYVCNTYFGTTPYSMDIVRMFNFDEKICRSILQSPLSDICSIWSNKSELLKNQENASDSVCQLNGGKVSSRTGFDSTHDSLPAPEVQMIQDEVIPSMCSIPVVTGENLALSADGVLRPVPISMDEFDASPTIKACKPLKFGKKATPITINLWKENGFSSLVFAAPELDTWCAVQELFPLLSYSAPFAIYHQYLQPLASCMHNLQVAKMAVGLQITEPWLREYQVLPSRTHPHMQMSSFGGYILSGIKVCSGQSQNAN
ncbi:hypothetical protein Sjap_025451 [Stephania japonica]|uniref:tRNA (adenine(58)-N(1))-methyltransferase non-catalytic subunit TRM6 n=1 Tax=Stephania japonica TaxID=461633 RepID=A0AAP0E4B5_9MAGN